MVKYRLFSTTRLLSNSVGYGDLWDDEHNCPDHGHFKGAPNQTWAGENISMATESYVKNIADDYDGTLADVDASLRRDNARTKRKSIHIHKSEPDTGNSRSATGYD